MPGARSTEPAGEHAGALRVRLAAPPVDGRANAELLRWAADALGVGRGAVALVRGASGRRKTLAVEFATPAALAQAQATVAGWRQP